MQFKLACTGRHALRLRSPQASAVPPRQCAEQQHRRINVLQCLSASTDPTSLEQLAARPAPEHDAAAAQMQRVAAAVPLSRRTLLALASMAVAVAAQQLGPASTARAEEASAVAASTSGAEQAAAPGPLTQYNNTAQKYQLLVPASWESKGKAGADALFEDPARRSTSVGVTVNPVKVASIDKFGSLAEVGDKLLEAEKKKESTLAVSLVSSSERQGGAGAKLYEYEYELDSTRGRKRILNTVTIFNSRLYILNAAYKCEKEACGEESLAGVQLLRRVAATFDVQP
ncbi:hypothetical protein CHLRE_16g678851v5 [Chlamydomonas reinhardtii]|uniref:PsbP C-terminal domain-containing protein n=1 Tax=Chlamydomonas reinhardtii TaxID=3055 RepID=A0A2K3CV74_CHLRE|nr:uncharacterized protein CHLRE_16g678851v5 [Chlamydomonas reinhardtii]PNW72184.1 hypothetical protein CHLRE_16g678851v5 [Chlamydomonas reinhardtii]